jgi:hypothetical protein
VDARQLLDAGPDGYTAARDAEVRRRRAEKDRDGATALKALGKPPLALWAVLVAANDAKLARHAVESTAALGAAQGAAVRGKGAEQIADAAAARRGAIDALTEAAVTALADHGKAVPRGADGHRAEIRSIIDRVSRHPELLDDWLEGTLRDIPADTGFDAFAAIAPAPPSTTNPPPTTRPPTRPSSKAPSTPASSPAVKRPSAAAERRRADAERRRNQAEQARANAQASVGEAEGDVAEAERAVREAQRALAAAEKTRDAAEYALERARRALAMATAKVEAAG